MTFYWPCVDTELVLSPIQLGSVMFKKYQEFSFERNSFNFLAIKPVMTKIRVISSLVNSRDAALPVHTPNWNMPKHEFHTHTYTYDMYIAHAYIIQPIYSMHMHTVSCYTYLQGMLMYAYHVRVLYSMYIIHISLYDNPGI